MTLLEASSGFLLQAGPVLQEVSQLLEAPVVVIPDVGQGFIELVGDLLQQESVEVRQIQRLLLFFIEGFQTFLNDPCPILIGQTVPAVRIVGQLPCVHVRNLLLTVEAPQVQVLLPV